MAGLPADFLAVIGEVDVKCKANKVYEAPDSATPLSTPYTVRDKFYLASQKEIFGSEDTPADGSVLLPYYEGAADVDRIKYRMDSHTTARNWFMRTPYHTNSISIRIVYSDGTLNDAAAFREYGCVPACTIY